MVIWKEQKHDNDDSFAEENVGCIVALRGFGLLKFFCTLTMVSHENLLEYLLRMWNPKQQYFEVGSHVLTIEVEDIYFLIGLSRRGAPISLIGSHWGDVTIEELINRHCIPGTRMFGKKISIKAMMDNPLCVVIFTMHRLAGSQGPHQDSRAHILYPIEAMAPIVFN